MSKFCNHFHLPSQFGETIKDISLQLRFSNCVTPKRDLVWCLCICKLFQGKFQICAKAAWKNIASSLLRDS